MLATAWPASAVVAVDMGPHSWWYRRRGAVAAACQAWDVEEGHSVSAWPWAVGVVAGVVAGYSDRKSVV